MVEGGGNRTGLTLHLHSGLEHVFRRLAAIDIRLNFDQTAVRATSSLGPSRSTVEYNSNVNIHHRHLQEAPESPATAHHLCTQKLVSSCHNFIQHLS
jgi:hypothetical protein